MSASHLTTPATDIDLALAADLAQQLRVDSVRSSTSAGSGHPTSSMSAADLLAVLVGRHFRYDWDNPHHAANDHLIFSKGHASPLLYSIFKAVGVVSDEELMTGYRRFGSRLAAISQANICLVGSHAGVEIGADGPSQMALEDLAMLRAVHGSTVLYPSDATSTAALVQAMADRTGISYLRTTRGAYPVLYDAAETFPIGGSKVLRQAEDDQVTLIGAGVTLHACLAAADQLKEEGISARVIDLYSVKPVDTDTLTAAATATRGRLVLVEDHHPEGGLGSAVIDALTSDGRIELAVAHLAVREMPGSGTSAELLDAAGISAEHIAAAARRLLG